MELRHLRYFVVLAEELHFGRAAARLCITQPPLSFNIKQLETELGVILLERDNKRVALTQAGRAFFSEATAILAKAERATALAKAIAAGRLGRLDVGFSGSMIYMHLADITRRFKVDFPGVELVLHEFGMPDQIEALEHGSLDIGLVDSLVVPDGLAGCRLGEESYVCCVPATHALAGMPDIELRQLAGEDFVSFNRAGSPTSYDRVVSMCVAAGFTPKISHRVRNWLTIIALVSEGFGVALVPKRLALTGFSGVRFVPIATPDHATSIGHILWHPERFDDRVRNFTATAQQVLGIVEVP